jgi:hypothetical protein
VEDLEVANFELKKALCTDVKDEIQLRRTIKAMKSISMMLRDYGLQCPPVCCMRGRIHALHILCLVQANAFLTVM